MAVTTLANIRDRVEADLMDSGNATWSTAELDAHIRRALIRYSQVNPQTIAADLSSSADTREYSLATLTGLKWIYDVWFPYNDADPEYPPNRPQWDTPYDAYLYLQVVDAPSGAATEKIRVFYTKFHELKDLDGATTTSLDPEGEQLIVIGAAAYAAEQLAQARLAAVNASEHAPLRWMQWASDRLQRFEDALAVIQARANQALDPRVNWSADL